VDNPPLAVVAGVGPERGLGAGLAKQFADKGLHVFVSGRTAANLDQVVRQIRKRGGSATPVVADVTVKGEVGRLFNLVRSRGSSLEVAAYNVGSNIAAPFLETEMETFTALWQQNCLGAFLFARETIDLMRSQEKGTVFFTGATASLRAKPPFTAFASAKAGLRSLAQGLAREFGPQGIHVVHAVIDGVINGDYAKEQFPEYVKTKGEDGMLEPEAIARTYWAIHEQHPSAWSHELDLRPFKEPF
jgi:NAD(P)-dependent dehydrogenase (short-subunit alcohol dehydrogenase family)